MILLKRVLLCLLLTGITGLKAQNYVSTFSGYGSAGFINGPVAGAAYNNPFGMCTDRNKNIFIADGGNNCIRKISRLNGIVTTFAGTGVAGFKDGPADSAQFNSPSDLCTDDSGNVFVSDFLNQRIRKISIQGVVSTVAGNGIAGYLNGANATAQFNYPRGICLDHSGNIYISDSWNHRIRKIDTTGYVSTFAGGGTAMGVSSIGSLLDGIDTAARFYTPSGLTIDQYGNLFVADAYNHRIRKVDTSKTVTTIIGSGLIGPGYGGYLNDLLNLSRLNTPTEIFYDTINNELYISDTYNNRIRKTNFVNGTLETYAGQGSASFINAIDTVATFNFPRGIIVVDSISTEVYVSDHSNHSIRLIAPNIHASVNDDDESMVVNLFPNPFISSLKISGSFPIKLIKIFSLDGKMVFSQNQQNLFSEVIDLSFLEKGSYILQIWNISGKISSKKIMHIR